MKSDLVFMFLCTVMVFFMTPGLAMFYGGMVRRKNVLDTMMLCLGMMGIGMFMWAAVGYSLSFSGDNFGIIGDLHKVFLSNVSLGSGDGEELPEIVTVMFNMMFAVISPAIIMGSLAERMRFSKMMAFSALWSLLVYYPLSHLTWGGGLVEQMGAIDFAGGTVIHISTGVSGLTACILMGKRRGHGSVSWRPHNLPMFVLGAAILWAGWFGFNCGCAGGANETAMLAFINTALASASGMIAWMILEGIRYNKSTAMGSLTGAIAGLVGITPGAGYVPVWSAFPIGAVTAVVVYFAMTKLKSRFGYDDTLDAFGCHGMGGICGCLLTGLFATGSVNPDVTSEGLFFGGAKLLGVQAASVVIAAAVAIVMTIIILKVLGLFGELRVPERAEAVGLDTTAHFEQAYPSFNGLD